MKKRKIALVLLMLVLAIVIGGFAYVQDYYHSDAEAFEALQDSANVTVEVENDRIAFIPDNADTGVIFYPGAKVQYESYAPLLSKLAEKGILCVLLKMPGNLAILDKNAAKGLQENYPKITHWYMAGHSLGGSIAAMYIAKHVDEFDGLILLASYSITDISDTNLNVICIYGSNDGVLKLENYEKNKSKLPDDFSEYIIEGGCHGYFGNYGMQKGDGTPTITRDEQQNETIEKVVERIVNLK